MSKIRQYLQTGRRSGSKRKIVPSAPLPRNFQIPTFRWKIVPKHKSGSADPERGHSDRKDDSRRDSSNDEESVHFSIPQMPAIEEHVIDPFDIACVPLGRDVHTLLQYYIEVCHPNVWKTEHCLGSSKQYLYQYTVRSVIEDCLRQPVNMYAILASMASQSVFLHHLTLEHQTGYFSTKAVVALRADMLETSSFTDRTIFNMFHLGCAEFYQYQDQAALVHLQAIQKAVESRGGLAAIDPALRELLILGDGYVAADSLCKPLLDASGVETSYHTPPEVLSDYYAIITRIRTGAHKVGSAFLRPRCKAIVPPELRQQIVELIVSLELLKTFGLQQHIPALRTRVLHWLHTRNLLIRHRMLNMRFENAQTDLIRITVVAWTLLTMSGAGRVRVVKNMSRLLQRDPAIRGHSDWTGIEEMRLWPLLVLAMCAADGSPEQAWFVAEIRLLREVESLKPKQIVWSVEGLLQFCAEFFVLENVQQPMLEGLMGLLDGAPD